MFCPDCGRECKDDEHYCASCGYPLDSLRKRIGIEQSNSLGWAEKILSVPQVKQRPVSELPLVSFDTGEEAPAESEAKEKGVLCERCGKRVDVGMICPNCGDRLPIVGVEDPYISEVLRGALRLVFAPRDFAIKLAYPARAGILQPFLWPGVFSAFFVFSLPFSKAGEWQRGTDLANILVPAIALIPIYILGIPLLIYLTAGLTHIIGKALGSKVSFRRTLRVLSAGLIWLIIFGTLRNVLLYANSYTEADLLHFFRYYLIDPDFIRELLPKITRMMWAVTLAFIGWMYAWMFGGLYRFSWWKTLLHTLATYCSVLWWVWLYVMIVIPLKASGFL